ncbi:MAG: DNA-binding domain-containing protein, partial [Verrucomicrobiales bacterium]|nr:DNA-binding domain-containing protein [Verrucomicrobiales bacterium]
TSAPPHRRRGAMNPPDTPREEVSRVQRWFQAVVTHPDGVEAGADSDEAQRLINLPPGQLEKVITRSRALSAAERLAIYANAYHTRLLECLGEVYPMLKRALGEEAFDGFAFGYLQEYPSRSYTLNELGRHFPPYLQETRPTPDNSESESASVDAEDDQPALVQDWPDFLIDLARLEWAIYEVFDGAGVEGQPLLQADQLLDILPQRWPQAQLHPVACLQLLTTRFPVNDYYTVLRKAKDDEAVPIPSLCESFVALTRRQFVVRRYNLSRTEFELLHAIKEGQTIGAAVERAALTANAEVDQLAADLKLWFRNWTAEGFFQSVEMAQ